MANVAVTYTFTNGTTADGSQVNTNFSDIINGTSDGTKDFNINALTVLSTATFSGAVTLGNGAIDDITITGSLASSIPVKTNAAFNIGSATLGLLSVYFGNSTFTTRVITAATATYTLTLPVNAGTNGYVPETNGSATLAWVPNLIKTFTQTADTAYTVLDTDGYRVVNMNITTGTGRILTLPAVANNTHRILTVRKIGAGAGQVTIDTPGAETIDGNASVIIWGIYDSVTLQSDGTNWSVLNSNFSRWVAWTPTGTFDNTTYTGFYRRYGDTVDFQVFLNITGSVSAVGVMTVTLPNSWTIDTAKVVNATTTNRNLGVGTANRSVSYPLHVRYATTTAVGASVWDDAASGVVNQAAHVTNGVPDNFVNGDEITLRFSVPITQLAI